MSNGMQDIKMAAVVLNLQTICKREEKKNLDEREKRKTNFLHGKITMRLEGEMRREWKKNEIICSSEKCHKIYLHNSVDEKKRFFFVNMSNKEKSLNSLYFAQIHNKFLMTTFVN